MIDNAISAACDTQPSWEWRCYAMGNELGANFSEPTTRYGKEAERIEELTDDCKNRDRLIERKNKRIIGLQAALRMIATKRHSYPHEAHNCDHRAALDSCIDLAKNALAKLEEKT
jgi:hypothetical protein